MAIFEFTPILLAFIAIAICTINFPKTNRKVERLILSIGILMAVLLIIAQMSWFTSVVVQHNLVGTWFANRLWTIFNSTSMILLIIFAYSRDRR